MTICRNNRPRKKQRPSINSSKHPGVKMKQVALPFFFIHAGRRASSVPIANGSTRPPHLRGSLSAPIAAILLPSPPTPFSMAVRRTLVNGSRRSGGCAPPRPRPALKICNDFFTSPVIRRPGPGYRNYGWPWLLPTPHPVGVWLSWDARLFCPPGKNPSRPWSSPLSRRFSRQAFPEESE